MSRGGGEVPFTADMCTMGGWVLGQRQRLLVLATVLLAWTGSVEASSGWLFGADHSSEWSLNNDPDAYTSW